MKTPDYHNPQGVPESALNPGERFLLKEEVGTDGVYENCSVWIAIHHNWANSIPATGRFKAATYKTTLPLPAEYLEPDYSDPEYQRSIEQAFRDGKRVQVWYSMAKKFGVADAPCWDWQKYKYRIHPDDLNKPVERDWTTPEAQAECRRMWADNPAMEREVWNGNTWVSIEEAFGSFSETWNGRNFYRPAQKPREKTHEELDEDAFKEALQKLGWVYSTDPSNFRNIFLAGVKYAREASRKEGGL